MPPRDRELDRLIGQRVAEARTKKQMSKVELARRLGRQDPNTSAQKYEKGESGLSPADLLKISDLLDVSLDWLIRGVHPKGEVVELTPAEIDGVLDHFRATPDERAAFADFRRIYAHARVTAAYIDVFLHGRRSHHDVSSIAKQTIAMAAREAAIAETGSASKAEPGALRRRKPVKKK